MQTNRRVPASVSFLVGLVTLTASVQAQAVELDTDKIQVVLITIGPYDELTCEIVDPGYAFLEQEDSTDDGTALPQAYDADMNYRFIVYNLKAGQLPEKIKEVAFNRENLDMYGYDRKSFVMDGDGPVITLTDGTTNGGYTVMLENTDNPNVPIDCAIVRYSDGKREVIDNSRKRSIKKAPARKKAAAKKKAAPKKKAAGGYH
jgi:hypothetical protein